MYDTYSDTRNFINEFLTEICINENQPVQENVKEELISSLKDK